MMNTNMILLPDKEGNTLLGVITPLGVVPIATFSSFDELRRFAMGLLGYCEFFTPVIPDVFLRAFSEGEDKDA